MLTYTQLIEKLRSKLVFRQNWHENTRHLYTPYVDFLQLITKFEINKKDSKKYSGITEILAKYDKEICQ